MSMVPKLELPEWGYATEELDMYYRQVLCGCVEGPVCIVMLTVGGVHTNKVVVVPGGMDVVKAVEAEWPVDAKLLGTVIGRLDSIRDVLQEYRVGVKFTGYGTENIYRWEPWMEGLIVR